MNKTNKANEMDNKQHTKRTFVTQRKIDVSNLAITRHATNQPTETQLKSAKIQNLLLFLHVFDAHHQIFSTRHS